MSVSHFLELVGMKFRKGGKQRQVSGAGMVIRKIPAGLVREKVKSCGLVDLCTDGKGGRYLIIYIICNLPYQLKRAF